MKLGELINMNRCNSEDKMSTMNLAALMDPTRVQPCDHHLLKALGGARATGNIEW